MADVSDTPRQDPKSALPAHYHLLPNRYSRIAPFVSAIGSASVLLWSLWMLFKEHPAIRIGLPDRVGWGLGLFGALLYSVHVSINRTRYTWEPERPSARLHPWDVETPPGVLAKTPGEAIRGALLLLVVLLIAAPVSVWSARHVLEPDSNFLFLFIVLLLAGAGFIVIQTMGQTLRTVLTHWLLKPETVAGRIRLRVVMVATSLLVLGIPAYQIFSAGRQLLHDSATDCQAPDAGVDCALMLDIERSEHEAKFYLLLGLESPIVALGLAVFSGLIGDAFASRRIGRHRGPRASSRTASPDAPARNWRVAHWSDLHLTVRDDSVGLEGGSPTRANSRLRSLVGRFRNELEGCDAVVITGDITDTGQSEEWRNFFDIVQTLPPAVQRRIVILPGNHDVNIVDPTRRTAVEPDDSRLRHVRLLRMIAAIDCIQGDRAYILDEANRRVLLRDYLDGFRRPLLDSIQRDVSSAELQRAGATWYFNHTVSHVWEQMFPMVVEVERDGEVLEMVIFDSNAPSSNLATNAFGYVPLDMLRRLVRFETEAWSENPKLYCLHHHVTPPREALPTLERAKTAFMVLHNADGFLDCMPDASHSVVLHGHRHVSRRDETRGGTTTVIGAPSTTLGDCNPDTARENAGFLMLTLATRGASSTEVLDTLLLVDEGEAVPVAPVRDSVA